MNDFDIRNQTATLCLTIAVLIGETEAINLAR